MAVKFLDYYETLGVSRTASADEIKQAFRKLARIHHPDVAKNKASGEVKFKEINEAYEVLGDAEKRKRYDELGANWQEGPAGGNRPPRRGAPQGGPDFEFGGTGFSDFFESFFAGGHGGGREPGDGGALSRAGGDLEADLLVTLEEALRGSPRTVTLRRSGGRGAADRTDTYRVRIPQGVREGQRIRLAGQGGAGRAGGAAGDLYLRVRLALHPDFRVQDSDLHYDLDLAPWEAVLGVQVKIPALDGPALLRVPPGTAGGSQLRLRGLGLPQENGTRGDLYATVRVLTPTPVTPAEGALWRQLAALSEFKPRGES